MGINHFCWWESTLHSYLKQINSTSPSTSKKVLEKWCQQRESVLRIWIYSWSKNAIKCRREHVLLFPHTTSSCWIQESAKNVCAIFCRMSAIQCAIKNIVCVFFRPRCSKHFTCATLGPASKIDLFRPVAKSIVCGLRILEKRSMLTGERKVWYFIWVPRSQPSSF
jgi:hypothetical protein